MWLWMMNEKCCAMSNSDLQFLVSDSTTFRERLDVFLGKHSVRVSDVVMSCASELLSESTSCVSQRCRWRWQNCSFWCPGMRTTFFWGSSGDSTDELQAASLINSCVQNNRSKSLLVKWRLRNISSLKEISIVKSVKSFCESGVKQVTLI